MSVVDMGTQYCMQRSSDIRTTNHLPDGMTPIGLEATCRGFHSFQLASGRPLKADTIDKPAIRDKSSLAPARPAH
jgi:hypothetical protein